jgi:hypothetical protein
MLRQPGDGEERGRERHAAEDVLDHERQNVSLTPVEGGHGSPGQARHQRRKAECRSRTP